MNRQKKIWLGFFITFSVIFPNIVNATVYEYKLDNGLRLLVKEDHRSPVVVSQVWYKIGSSYEHDGITGISHVLEHMMFKGTTQNPDGEFSRIIAENGGSENAFTGKDYTAYFQTLEKSRLKTSFELEADRMRFLSLPKDEFIKEIQVVIEERRLRTEDNPQSFLREAARATAFQTSPYRFPIIGWMHDLESMTIEQVKDWYLKWYAPNNATVVVVGDVQPQEVFALAKKYFGNLPKGAAIFPHKKDEVKQVGFKQIKVMRPAELPYLMMLYKTPSEKPQDKKKQAYDFKPYALEVLSSILDGGESARFSSNIVRGSEAASFASVYYPMMSRLDDVLTISGVPAEGKTIKELKSAIYNELSEIKTNLVGEKELQRVKAQAISSNIYQKDSMFYQAMIIGMLETMGLSHRLADTYVERIKAVTAEQVRQVAREYLIDDYLTVAELAPLPLEKSKRLNDSVKKGVRHVH